MWLTFQYAPQFLPLVIHGEHQIYLFSKRVHRYLFSLNQQEANVQYHTIKLQLINHENSYLSWNLPSKPFTYIMYLLHAIDAYRYLIRGQMTRANHMKHDRQDIGIPQVPWTSKYPSRAYPRTTPICTQKEKKRQVSACMHVFPNCM